MKRILSVMLILILCLSISIAAMGEENGIVTIQDWLDSKGGNNGTMVVCVKEIINPVLALVEDETGGINLFGVTIDGEFRDLDAADIKAGDVLILANPRYNEYEGSVEMADSVLVRKISVLRNEGPGRTEATQYEFAASPDQETEINDLIFNGDVTVTGEGEAVRFNNCEFRGNVINACPTRTVVWIMPECEFAEGCHCAVQSGVREADMDYAIPKIATCIPVDVECPDLGGVIAAGTFDIVMDGRTYTVADVEYYQGEDGSIVPYEDGMEAGAHVAIRWWENGEEVVFTMGVQ